MFINFQGGKSETTMAHKNKIKKYPVDTTSQNKSCLLRRLKSRLEKDEISAGPQKTFYPNPQPFTHQQIMQRQRIKINKTMLSRPLLPLISFPQSSTKFTISELKCK